ncbi:hypothetical protein ACFQZI_12480 [Mucilaginibacter lutimaris]|uniref:Uncharacterized protein n=1 Tax=Mucilaginibacter lutimaris TaxID=931629 RepID=A0ABW2ZHK0_9SPHI
MKNVNEQKDSIAIKCSNCGKTEKYQPQNISQEWYFRATGKPSEDYFGLPLWLEADFRGHNLLAYNYKHLAYLKQYISADLRERSNRSHWTMVEKLPTWMTSAKNRDKIIKLISDLERK